MCGIVGYVGKKNAADLLVDGLRKLEYRGYDSAGIAVVSGGRLEIRRSVGKLAELEKVITAAPVPGQIGLGHTRWATHGVPSVQNAHPHVDFSQNVAVVHNGIIENYATLKDKLIKSGIQFQSETDTEVVAHLIGFHLKHLTDSNGHDPVET